MDGNEREKTVAFWKFLVGSIIHQCRLEAFLGAGSFGAVCHATLVARGEIVGGAVALKLMTTARSG
ncbi:hypothetical protein HL658_35560 [Azospirillum sp. RWY-5-1]|uniref:Protein kinase domain-containing protein n=1 Tax=Azospirillum oleiclasticum TaxID=2735135 RepID=A0ABX2TL69_9PROT|nr:hypothetical protein [Azospirillum oleiclasticum]NYZ17889.1 hypothetical protein [Azospirillum oleiclasticum]NYZ25097.1 hypothetical protein [Azospirillum oleiclasticum]